MGAIVTPRKPVKADTEVTAWFPYDEPFTVCPACGGDVEPLGQLGKLMHFRCRRCGLDCHTNVN